MHYPPTAFSRNGLPTIETLHGESIGQRNSLSEGDILVQ
jgi:astacin (peptidase family M12A)